MKIEEVAKCIKTTIKNRIKVKSVNYSQVTFLLYSIYINFEFSEINKKIFSSEVFPLIKRTTEKYNLYLIYDEDDLRFRYNNNMKLYIKDKIGISATVPKFLYHRSLEKNRESILKKGIIPQPFENSDWKGNLGFYYEPAVFCSDNKHEFKKIFYGYDIWKIDTKGLNNKWFVDCNNLQETYSIKKNHSYMTYEPIPHKALTFIENKEKPII